MFGLAVNTINSINSIFLKYEQIESVIIYGSRAKGNYKSGSDIDLTLNGNNINMALLTRIENELDDLLLPYSIDLSIFDKLNQKDLIEHIERVGKKFYQKS
jgi:predicted nucleotidyltransferase